MRARVPLALAAAAATLAVGLSAVAPAAKPTESQTFFRDALLKDGRTTSAIKGLLRSGAAFVDPRQAFVDLTGDAKPDAIVMVDSGGAAGAIAAYVFSTDGAPGGDSATLRSVFRSQSLYRAQARERTGALLVETPVWKLGDDVCCATKMLRREYTWSASARRFVRRAVLEYELMP
jgi:hypothetical protein